jgi:hypothetical protein
VGITGVGRFLNDSILFMVWYRQPTAVGTDLLYAAFKNGWVYMYITKKIIRVITGWLFLGSVPAAADLVDYIV